MRGAVEPLPPSRHVALVACEACAGLARHVHRSAYRAASARAAAARRRRPRRRRRLRNESWPDRVFSSRRVAPRCGGRGLGGDDGRGDGARWLAAGAAPGGVLVASIEAAAARSCWVELHDLCREGGAAVVALGSVESASAGAGGGGVRRQGGGSGGGGGASRRKSGGGGKGGGGPATNDNGNDDAAAAASTAACAALEGVLSRHRVALLEGVLTGDGTLPRDFETLSAAEREEVDDAREDCRALLRGAVFVEAAGTVRAIEALTSHASASASAAAAAAAAAAADGAAQSDALVRSVCALEAALHALSAAAKPLGSLSCPPLSAALASLLPAAAQVASGLMSAGEGAGRGLLATLLILIGSLSAWLADGTSRHAEVACVLPVLLASLNVSEPSRPQYGAALEAGARRMRRDHETLRGGARRRARRLPV